MSASTQKISATAQKISARLNAVQAVYQMTINEQDAKSTTREYLEHRAGMTVDEETFVQPDQALLSGIIQGVDAKVNDLREIVHKNLNAKDDKTTLKTAKSVEPLLESILLCGVYEIMNHDDVDAPIIINDYIEIADSFYDSSAKKLVNAVLDNVTKLVRN